MWRDREKPRATRGWCGMHCMSFHMFCVRAQIVYARVALRPPQTSPHNVPRQRPHNVRFAIPRHFCRQRQNRRPQRDNGGGGGNGRELCLPAQMQCNMVNVVRWTYTRCSTSSSLSLSLSSGVWCVSSANIINITLHINGVLKHVRSLALSASAQSNAFRLCSVCSFTAVILCCYTYVHILSV